MVDGEEQLEHTLRNIDEFKKSKVLHFAMHGGERLNDVRSITAIKKQCESSQIKCVFFNACSTKGIGSSELKSCVDHVIYWESDVHDEASRAFAERFYHYLGLARENSLHFSVAFNKARDDLVSRGWILVDPASGPEIRKKQREMCMPDLHAAGVPVMITERLENPKENEFLINGITIDLPNSEHFNQDVANACGEAILHGARIGVGERQLAKGMLVLVGSEKQFEDIGYAGERNKFKYENICIQDWRDGENESFILSCFASDLALFVEGKTGRILADQYTVDLPTRQADQGGGTKHKNSSAAGMKGLLAIKCSEDCCSNDGIGKDNLKIFSGRKEPILVPVPPPK